MATKKAEVKTLEILSVDLVEVPITIVGKTPLIVHRWSEKAKREIRMERHGRNQGSDRTAEGSAGSVRHQAGRQAHSSGRRRPGPCGP